MDRPRLRLLLPVIGLALLAGGLPPAGLPGFPLRSARADDAPEVPDRVRRAAIRDLRGDLARKARSARALRDKDEILEMLDALAVLGGPEAAEAALRGLPVPDEEVRDRIFALVESEGDEDLVGPLIRLLEDKDYRRDFDAKRRIARALSIFQDTDAVLPLTELIRTDEDAEVVAAAADALATFAGAPLRLRREAVEALIQVYTATWNLMMSMRPEDKVMRGVMEERYEVYGRSVRACLQALTGQQITRPQEWTEWWNDNKKRRDW